MALVSGYALLPVPFVLMNQEFGGFNELFDDEEDDEPVSAWKETPEARVLQADLPGFNKEDITVEVKNYKVLTIKGGTTQQNSKQQPMQVFFMRQIPLPEDIKPKEMTCTIDNGVLLIKAPKSTSPKPSKRLLAITN